MVKTKRRAGGTSYEVWVYNPATQKPKYICTCPKKGTKGGAETDDPKQFAYAAELRATRDLRARHERGNRLTLTELRPKWIAAKSHTQAKPKPWKASTLKHNVERTAPMLDEFGDQHPDDIERVVAQEWARSHPRCVDQARAFVNWLRDEGYCTTNPFERPGISKGPGRKHDKPLTEDDLAALDEACAVLGSYANSMRGWLHFQAYVGCRPAEGLGLTRADLDLKLGEVHIREQKYRDGSLGTPKNGRERTVILPDPAREKLTLIPTRLGSPWLFHNKRGDELLYPSMLGYWHSILAASGLATDRRWLDSKGQPQGVDPYHLRHFCGSHLADLGCTAQDIAEQLGHTDGGALAQELYIHTYSERSRARLHEAYRSRPADTGSREEIQQGRSHAS